MATKKTASKSAPARKTASRPAKKTASKSTAKSTSKVNKVQESKPAEKSVETTKTTSASTASSTSSKGFKIKKSYVILIATVLALAALLYFGRSLLVAAVVNGQPISRLSVVQEAEKQSGKQVMTTLIRNTLIEQEARKQKVTVNEKEIDDEIKKLEGNLQKQGQKLDQVLQMQGMSKDDLRKLIRLDKLVGKMVGKDIKITDDQVKKYIEENRDALPTGQDEAQLNSTVREQLKQQELNNKVRTWLENLQNNAKINKFVNY